MTGALARLLAVAVMAFASVFLLAPLVIIALSSLSPTPVFDLPVGGASLRWYVAVGSLDGFWPALSLSLEIALLSTAISLVIGTLAGSAIVRRIVPGAGVLAAAATSPLMMPGLVLGIALLQYFRSLGLIQTWASLLLAHLVVTLPFVARTMIAGLSRFDFTLIDAARMLGCGFASSIWRVVVPGACLPDRGAIRLPRFDGQLPGLDLCYRRAHEDPPDQDAAIYRGKPGPFDRGAFDADPHRHAVAAFRR